MKKILFIIILFGTIVFTGYIMRPKDTDVCVQQISDFHSIEKNTLDAIVYGSSHSWLGFDAKEFESITGYRTYNYSCFWQSFNTTWLFINDSFITQTPKVVFVDVGRVNDYLHNMELEGQIYYTRKLKISKEKIMFLIQCFGNNLEGYISYCFPIVSFHNKWENISELFEEKQHNDFISSSGQMISNGHTSFKNELIGYNMRSDDEMTEYILSINEYEGGEIGEQDICPENIVLMNDITDAFVRGRNFEIALKFSLDKVVEVMGFTGAFYLDENLSLIATKHSNIVNITELSWGDIKQIVEDQNMLNLHHIDYMKDVNINVYNYLMRYRVISLLVKKVRFATGNFGYIAFTDSAKSRVWQDKDITILTYIEKLIGIFKTYNLK